MEYIRVFYIIVCSTMIFLGIAIYFVFKPISEILAKSQSDSSSLDEAQIRTSIMTLKYLYYLVIANSMVAAVHIIFDIDYMVNFTGHWLNEQKRVLISCVIHSVTLWIMGMFFVLMIVERKGSCCYVSRFSLWYSCCSCFITERHGIRKTTTEAGTTLLELRSSLIKMGRTPPPAGKKTITSFAPSNRRLSPNSPQLSAQEAHEPSSVYFAPNV